MSILVVHHTIVVAQLSYHFQCEEIDTVFHIAPDAVMAQRYDKFTRMMCWPILLTLYVSTGFCG